MLFKIFFNLFNQNYINKIIYFFLLFSLRLEHLNQSMSSGLRRTSLGVTVIQFIFFGTVTFLICPCVQFLSLFIFPRVDGLVLLRAVLPTDIDVCEIASDTASGCRIIFIDPWLLQHQLTCQVCHCYCCIRHVKFVAFYLCCKRSLYLFVLLIFCRVRRKSTTNMYLNSNSNSYLQNY